MPARKPTTSKPRSRRSSRLDKKLDTLWRRVEAGENLTTSLEPILTPIRDIQRKVLCGQPITLRDAQYLREVIRKLDHIRQAVRGLAREGNVDAVAGWLALLTALPEIVLLAGRRVGVDLDLIARLIGAWKYGQDGGTVEAGGAACWTVEAGARWKAFEAALDTTTNAKSAGRTRATAATAYTAKQLRQLAGGISPTMLRVWAREADVTPRMSKSDKYTESEASKVLGILSRSAPDDDVRAACSASLESIKKATP
jgi:hypothetical protein